MIVITKGMGIGGVRLQNTFGSPTARRATRTLPRNEKFGAPSPGGRSVREITSREETERLPENRLGRSQHAPASQEPKARWRCGSADPTAPEQISQVPLGANRHELKGLGPALDDSVHREGGRLAATVGAVELGPIDQSAPVIAYYRVKATTVGFFPSPAFRILY